MEDLRKHDLDDIVLPILNIDEFKSKIDEDNIVVTFSVNDKDAAYDLKFFLEKSFFDILADTEVSDYPSEDDCYYIFCEFNRNEDFPDDLMEIIEIISELTNIKSWKFLPYQYTEEFPITKENLQQKIRLTPLTVEESFVRKYVKESLIEKATYNKKENKLCMENECFTVYGTISEKQMTNYIERYFSPDDLMESSSRSSGIKKYFGDNFDIMESNNTYFIRHKKDTDYLILSKI